MGKVIAAITAHEPKSAMNRAIWLIAGLLIGAVVGFLVVLIAVGVLAGGAQSGVAAILFGVPFGAIAGAVIAAKQTGASLDDILGLPKEKGRSE